MAAASLALADLLGGQRLPDALDRQMSPLPPASRAPARDMAYQVVRRMGRLEAISARLNARRPTAPLLALQWVALVQLLDAQRPDAIVVDQTVEAARRLPGGAAAAGFLNATLRRFGRMTGRRSSRSTIGRRRWCCGSIVGAPIRSRSCTAWPRPASRLNASVLTPCA
jgi:16S rRNA (cytosine967-C5)-methyltransferase